MNVSLKITSAHDTAYTSSNISSSTECAENMSDSSPVATTRRRKNGSDDGYTSCSSLEHLRKAVNQVTTAQILPRNVTTVRRAGTRAQQSLDSPRDGTTHAYDQYYEQFHGAQSDEKSMAISKTNSVASFVGPGPTKTSDQYSVGIFKYKAVQRTESGVSHASTSFSTRSAMPSISTLHITQIRRTSIVNTVNAEQGVEGLNCVCGVEMWIT